MNEISAIATVAAISAVGILSPGPDFIAVSYTAVTGNRKLAALVAAGVVLGNGIWAGAALLGVGLLFELFPSMFLAIKFAGAVYLMWLGYKLLKNARTPLPEGGSTENAHLLAAFTKGLSTTMANPKAAIYYASALSTAAPSGAGWPLLFGMLLAVVVVATLWFSMVIFVLSNQRASLIFRKMKLYFESFFGVLLLFFGLKQFLSR
ncbi:LysE family transporter [Deefgea sp. CFH1-16]|uniref:LysE family transporter n=1 Tax=Deefgea sp. CFH1-16 TaxID=2675457 RepID=UPI0015F4343B|nr:LysE family transporter [Deefgea sp. CFH1-16]